VDGSSRRLGHVGIVRGTDGAGNVIGYVAGILDETARKLAAALRGPGGKVSAILKTMEDKAKEKQDVAPAAA